MTYKDKLEEIVMNNEFNSEFCNVKYIESDNIVFLTWKKFCSFDNYRTPAMFAADLLKSHADSNFVIDARNGFEDVKEDVEWGFSVYLPYMAQSDCKMCVFIMNEVSDIEGEIDLWTKEFMKYFQVKRALSYEDAAALIKQSCL